jgi:hypothetical protein
MRVTEKEVVSILFIILFSWTSIVRPYLNSIQISIVFTLHFKNNCQIVKLSHGKKFWKEIEG